MENQWEDEEGAREAELLAWLKEMLADEAPPEGVAPELLEQLPDGSAQEDAPASMHALWSAMTALAGETRLQGRAFEALREEMEQLRGRTEQLLGGHEESLVLARELARRQQDQQAEEVRAAREAAAREARDHAAGALMDARDRMVLGLQAIRQLGGAWEPARPASFLARLFSPPPPQAPPPESLEALAKGYQLGVDRLDEVLRGWGIRPLDVEGRPFDPRTMNAAEVADDPDADDGAVLEVVRPGYEGNGKVLRPAQVKVCRKARIPSNEPPNSA